MTRHRRSAMIAFLIISIAASAALGEDYYIYSPRQVAQPQEGVLAVGKDELLVREVLIKKGDTLSKLSRKYSGRGSYFPQILLFNEIRNPDLIYAGNTLKLPVGKQGATDVVRSATPEREGQSGERPLTTAEPLEQSQPDKTVISSKKMKDGRKRGSKKNAEKGKKKPLQLEKKSPSASPLLDTEKSAVPVSPATVDQSQRILFDQAVTAYRQNDCTKAMDLFDRFLAKNATSPLAAEASLLKAECLLKLSGTP